MVRFDYAAPSTVDEAVRLLAEADGAARPLAGGTDILPQVREGRRACRLLVDLKRIPELQRIDFHPERGLRIGAAASCWAVAHHPAVIRHYPAVRTACALIGSVLIQNRATLGGNLGNAAPSADGVPPLIVHGAVAVVAGPRGTRRIPVEEVCTGPGQTCLAPGEFVVEFQLPPPAPHTRSCYLRFIPRNEMDIAVAGVGVAVTTDPQGRVCRQARVALAAVAPTPLRVPEAEAYLEGKPLERAHLERAGELAAAAARPISDVRGSADYRRHLVGVLTRRALEACLAPAS